MKRIQQKLRKIFLNRITPSYCFLMVCIFIVCILIILPSWTWRKTDPLKKSLEHISASESGNYIIISNYIVGQNKYRGNSTVTLVLHSEYSKLSHLNKIVERWDSPISVAIFLRRNDLERVRHILSYMIKCTQQGILLKAYLSISFVVHKSSLPSNWPKNHEFYQSRVNCLENFHNFSAQDTLWSAREAANYPYPYPANYLRNAARRTVNTYYILYLDIDFLPPVNFPANFLNIAMDLVPVNYMRMVYVLSVIRVPLGSVIPTIKYILHGTDDEHLERYMPDDLINRMPYLKKWLHTKEPEQFGMIGTIQPGDHWLPWYVSVNDFEPLAQENYEQNSTSERITQINTLLIRNYTFVLLKGDSALILQYDFINSSTHLN